MINRQIHLHLKITGIVKMNLNDTIENDQILNCEFFLQNFIYFSYYLLGKILMRKFMLEIFQRKNFPMKNYWTFLNHLAKFQVCYFSSMFFVGAPPVISRDKCLT